MLSMSVLSTSQYTDIDSLRRTVDAVCQGLEAKYILVALPHNSIEVRAATIWERILSFTCFKPTNIRLKTIQPLISNFFKNNETLLASDPSLYPKLLQIYTNSIYPREKEIPLCLRSSWAFTQKALPPSVGKESYVLLNVQTTEETNTTGKNIEVPRRLLPPKFLEHLDILNQDKNVPFSLFDETSEETFELFLNYQKEGTLKDDLKGDQLIELAQLAAFLGEKELTLKLMFLLIDSLNLSNYNEIFLPLISLMVEEALPSIETIGQQLVIHLIAKARHLGDCIQKTHVEFLQSDSLKDNWLAQYLLAQFYEYGIGFPQDFEKAIHLYKTLAGQGNTWGEFEIGKWYQYAGGNLLEAFKHYSRSAQKEHVLALYHKAVLLNYGKQVKKDDKEALKIFQQLADKGERLGLYGLANFYRNGTEVRKDLVKAIKLYELAAERQEPRALYELALCYENGASVQKDLNKAFELYRFSALKGFMVSEIKVAQCYEHGSGTPRNLAEAREWSKKANKQKASETQAKEKFLNLRLVLEGT